MSGTVCFSMFHSSLLFLISTSYTFMSACPSCFCFLSHTLIIFTCLVFTWICFNYHLVPTCASSSMQSSVYVEHCLFPGLIHAHSPCVSFSLRYLVISFIFVDSLTANKGLISVSCWSLFQLHVPKTPHLVDDVVTYWLCFELLQND